MKIRWLSFKCQACGNVVHMRATTIKSRLFLCPVCAEGKIECHPEHRILVKGAAGLTRQR